MVFVPDKTQYDILDAAIQWHRIVPEAISSTVSFPLARTAQLCSKRPLHTKVSLFYDTFPHHIAFLELFSVPIGSHEKKKTESNFWHDKIIKNFFLLSYYFNTLL